MLSADIDPFLTGCCRFERVGQTHIGVRFSLRSHGMKTVLVPPRKTLKHLQTVNQRMGEVHGRKQHLLYHRRDRRRGCGSENGRRLLNQAFIGLWEMRAGIRVLGRACRIELDRSGTRVVKDSITSDLKAT